MVTILFTKSFNSTSLDPIDENFFSFIRQVLKHDGKLEIACEELLEEGSQRFDEMTIRYSGLTFSLKLKKRTINTATNLVIDLDIIDTGIDIRDVRISELKIIIKNCLLNYLDQCYWIYDEQSLSYSNELYRNINTAENLFRSYVIHYMLTKYGIGWWDKVTQSVKSKKTEREAGYETALTDLKGINVDLFSIDINDLNALVDNEYLINIEFSCLSNRSVPSDEKKLKDLAKEYLKKIPSDKISVNCETKNSFWDDFAKYYSAYNKFKEKWDRLCKNRNHIAHNKLISTHMFEVINTDTEYVISGIKSALVNFEKSQKSKEEIDFSKYIYRETRDSDLSAYGDSVYDEENIIAEFKDYIYSNIFEPIDDLLYFNSNVKDSAINEDYTLSPGVTLIKITHVNNSVFNVTISDVFLDDSEGGQSNIDFQVDNNTTTKKYTLYFKNVDVIKDEETGQYIPEDIGGINDAELFDGIENTNVILCELRNFLL